MPRSQNNVAALARKKKYLKIAKGYWGRRKNVWTVAKNHVEKGLVHAYTGRKLKKRDYRSLWIVRINAAARENGLSYSRFISGLKAKGVDINRKVLAKIAVENPSVFAELVNLVKN
ncbi:MAG: 50S ribosomal protein L20 [Ignavibacteriaceae bacterium]|nr:50S ribosomal protein L20 [Ignavibacteriaceae bacterium]